MESAWEVSEDGDYLWGRLTDIPQGAACRRTLWGRSWGDCPLPTQVVVVGWELNSEHRGRRS